MPFQPGQSGNANGRPPKGKDWANIVRKLGKQPMSNVEKKQRLEALAEKLWEMAMDGDMAAIKEIANRLDGKPGQEVEHRHSGSVFVEGLRQLDREREMKVIEGETIDEDTPKLTGSAADGLQPEGSGLSVGAVLEPAVPEGQEGLQRPAGMERGLRPNDQPESPRAGGSPGQAGNEPAAGPIPDRDGPRDPED